MNSHRYAAQLREIANILEQAECFELEEHSVARVDLSFYSNKQKFAAGCWAIGEGEKDYSDKHYFSFRRKLSGGAELTISAIRSLVCRKVQDEQWEFDTLLPEESGKGSNG